ncbi:MAG: hypothetical protein WBR15_04220 [Gammaproteobacteria bacterium]
MTMQRISSRQTFFIKRVLPVIWFGLLVVITVAVVFVMIHAHKYHVLAFVLIWSMFMMGVGYFVMKKLVFDLVDEVWDFGSELLVKNGGEEAHIPLANIANVGYAGYINPPRVTLTLRQPCRFGKEVTFFPKGISFSPFPKNRIARELIERVDALRTS